MSYIEKIKNIMIAKVVCLLSIYCLSTAFIKGKHEKTQTTLGSAGTKIEGIKMD